MASGRGSWECADWWHRCATTSKVWQSIRAQVVGWGIRICGPRPTHRGRKIQGGLGVLSDGPPYACIPTGLVIPTEDGMPTALWKYLDAFD